VGRQGDLFGQPPGHSAALALFEEWWQHYPRKVAKLQAQRTWMQIRPLPDHAFTERAIEAIERQKRDPEFWHAGGRYIPHPSTWLNAGRYLDEGLEERPAPSSFRDTCPHVPRCSTPTQCHLKTMKGT
jgi:hypothetical protein